MDKAEYLKETNLMRKMVDFIMNIPIFDALLGPEIEIAATHLQLAYMDKGDIIFKEGEEGDYMCFVVEGIIDIIKESSSGDFVVIASLSKGRSVGEMSVIDQTPRSASAVARTKAALLILNSQNFDKLLEAHPTIGIKILKGLTRLLSFNMRKTSSRLADYMLPIG